MDSHYVVERGVAFEAHTQLKINDGVTWYKLFINKFRAQMQKMVEIWILEEISELGSKKSQHKKKLFGKKSRFFCIVFWKHQLFTHIFDFRKKKKVGCRQSCVIIFLGVPPSRVAKGGDPHNFYRFFFKTQSFL